MQCNAMHSVVYTKVAETVKWGGLAGGGGLADIITFTFQWTPDKIPAEIEHALNTKILLKDAICLR